MSIYLEGKGEVERMVSFSPHFDTYIVWQVMKYFFFYELCLNLAVFICIVGIIISSL